MDSKNRKRPSTTPVRRSKRLKLLTDQSDSGDDGNSVRESQRSINDLPVECIQDIISYFPGRHWARLELVNQKFRCGVLAAWRCLREVHLKEYSEKRLMERDAEAEKQGLLSILRMVQIRSPTVQAIDGFESFSSTLDLEVMEEVAKLETLKAVTFLDCDFRVNDLASFLANSRSRASLEELCITSSRRSFHINPLMAVADDETIQRALIDIEGRPGLRLKTFRYTPKNRRYPSNLLPALDVSQLEILSLTDHGFESSAVAKFLGRCTQLKELEIDVCSLPHTLRKDILNALKWLPSSNLRKLEFRRTCHACDEDTIEVLKQLAQRCPKVEMLNIPGNNPDELLHVIGECFSNVKELNVGVYSVSKEAVAGLMTRMRQLKKLGIHCYDPGTRVMEDIIVALAMNTNRLTSLHLDLTPTLTNNTMSKLGEVKVEELSVKFPFVEERTVAVCQRLGPMMTSVDFDSTDINDKLCVAAIGNKRMRQLRRISLNHTFITDLSLHAIGDSCPLLKELDIGFCKAVTANGIRSMIEKCKKLIHLNVAPQIPGLRDLIRDSTVTIET